MRSKMLKAQGEKAVIVTLEERGAFFELCFPAEVPHTFPSKRHSTQEELTTSKHGEPSIPAEDEPLHTLAHFF